MEMTAGGNKIISWSELQRVWLINKNATQFRGSLFWPWYFQEVLHTYGITLAMNFDFPRISKTNLETSMEYLQRHFLDHPASFFLEQTIDQQIDLLF